MFRAKMTKILYLVMCIFMVLFIFLNPITQGKVDFYKISPISDEINKLANTVGFNLFRLNEDNLKLGIIILEYIIFGIMLMATTKIFFEKTLKNIFFPLFTGLLTAVLICNYGFKGGGGISGTDGVIIMFGGFVFGVVLYLVLDVLRPKSKKNKSFRRTKYSRRGR